MTNAEFISSIQASYAKGVEIIKKKNADYAEESDPFKNFRSASVAGVGVGRAIIVRVLDKLSRIQNLLDKEAMVKDASIEDTILDAINYLAILKAYLDNERSQKKL